ncbi:MAG: ATPase [Elusimicrobia bacterium]|nr:ATPase [Elusimicrobiota bacterium]
MWTWLTSTRPERRRDRLIVATVEDRYRAPARMPEPAVCLGCKAVYRKGRWQWLPQAPSSAVGLVCQACRRARDGFPAGTMTICGEFARQHEDEIIGLARRQAQVEQQEHPLHRIMRIQRTADGIVITTTDIHLPRRIGEALRRAFKGGRLELSFQKAGYGVRATWRREEPAGAFQRGARPGRG